MNNDLMEWAELILAAILERRDARPLVALALRAGVDLEVLQFFINAALDGVCDQLMGAAGMLGWFPRPTTGSAGECLSAEDLAALKDLGIDAS